ncbi:MAG: tetratricopeptide repeat protein [Desulfococcaceae bacterium]
MKTTQTNSADPAKMLNEGLAFHKEGRLDKAGEIYRKILEIQPNFPDALHLSGVIAHQTGNDTKAVELIEKAIGIHPKKSAYYSNMGLALHNLGRFDQAISQYRRALDLKPDFAEACYNMGNVFKDTGHPEKAISCYEKALHIRPEYGEPRGTLIHLLQQTCEWNKLESMLPVFDQMNLAALQTGQMPVETPFECLCRNTDPARNFAVAKAWSQGITRQAAQMNLCFSFENRRKKPGSPLIIAYLSNDFQNHATAHLMRSLFQCHNRDQFQIYCYSYGPDDGSDYRKKIIADTDRFTDILHMGHAESAQQIFADQVDILVDLKGHTRSNRLGICALRPAPVQVTWLGFPGTSGADFLDYVITDAIVSPENHAAYYSESFLYMPHCYQVNDSTQPISQRKWQRSDFALPENAFVFCSFNQNLKIEPVMFDVWMKILHQVPASVLWLIWENAAAEKNLKNEAEKRGISRDRLIFSKRMEKAEHLARHQLADIALDTRIVNGHTTTSDALWAGVPLIALQGSHFASRVSASILNAIGFSQLIADDLNAYESLAVQIALDPNRLKGIKEELWQNRTAMPLFDTKGFAGDLEAGFWEIWNRYLSGKSPDRIRIKTRENKVNQMISPEKQGQPNAAEEIRSALRLHEAGDTEAADKIYQSILARIPGHPDALHLSGVAAHQRGEHEKAVEMIRKAIAIFPNNPVFFSNLGAVLQAVDRQEEAAQCYRKAIEIKPGNPEAWYNLGNVLKNQEKIGESVSAYEEAIRLRPEYAEAWHNMGNAIQHEKPQQALEYYCKALDLKPDYPQAYNNLGNLHQAQKRLGEAIACYEKALELKPDYAEVQNNLANVYKDQGRMELAIASYRKALELKPELVETLNNLGISLNELDRKEEALTCYRQAAKLRPDYAETFNNMGNLFQSIKKTEEAIAYYRKAVGIDPKHSRAYSSLVFQLMHACAWQEIADMTPGLDKLTQKALEEERETEEMPFMSMMRVPDPAHNYAVAKSWSRALSKRMEGLGLRFSFDPRQRAGKKKIRVAYLSNDFHNHATAHLMRTFFGLHDRKKFEIFAYSYGKDDGSHYRKQIEKDCDRFVDIYDRNHMESAQSIHADQIDILVDLKGYTKGNRLEICAFRPAPVQVTYLGYPGTTGAEFLDYVITDRIVTPEEHEKFFTEKFVYMPNSYQVNDHVQPIAEKQFTRADAGLPENAFVFCSFNQVYKIDSIMFSAWMRILRQVPNSVMWIFRGGPAAEKNLKDAAAAVGIAPERIVFAQSMPKEEHLSRHKLADLALDTRIVNGHTTTSDALWAGLPVLTLQGSHFASRVSASLLNAVGLPELITNTLPEYESLAVHLANHPHELEKIKKKLWENRKTQPLFDTARFVKHLEKGYEIMWEKFLKGEKPARIAIEETSLKSSEEKAVQKKIPASLSANKPFDMQKELAEAVHLHQSGQIQAAEKIYQQILARFPQQPDALHLSGLAAHASGDNEKAEKLIKNAILHSHANPVYYSNLGAVLKGMGRSDEAIDSYRKAVEINPKHCEAWYNMGLALVRKKDVPAAISCFEKALEIRPEYEEAYSSLFFQSQHVCDWDRIARLAPGMDALTRNALAQSRKPAETPFMNMLRHADPAYNCAVAAAWAKQIQTHMQQTVPVRFSFDQYRKNPAKKIRIGYLSNGFHNHPTAHLMLGLFRVHKREQFEIYCYAYGKEDGTGYREKILQNCDKFLELTAMSHAQAAEQIYRDGIHILVDLIGFTGDNNTLLRMGAIRPAPVQVSYLAYPGTTGGDFFDYVITDRIVSPPEHTPHFSEKFVYMPNCYQINDSEQPISQKQMKRADFSLPENAFVFCSFNNNYKIEPVMFDIWMNILRRVPGSVLWLLRKHEAAEKNLKKAAQIRGIDPERLIFASILMKDEHLARHRLADLALDTRIVNGHTTTSDALWGGLPVITMQGSHFASRVSASILTAIGLPELITHSLQEYENLAVRLAGNPKEIFAVRKKLAENRIQSSLFDTPRFTIALEAAYRKMWELFLAGSSPKQMQIAEGAQPVPQPRQIAPPPPVQSPAPVMLLPPDLQRELETAVRFHQQGNAQQAGAIYRNILELHPNHPDALHLSGVLCHQQGDYAKAVSLIEKAIAVFPHNPLYYSNLAASLHKLGKKDQAIFCYEKAIAIKPDYADAYYSLGNLCRAACRLADAIAHYQKVLDFKPADPAGVYNNMGVVWQDLGKNEKALECYQKALDAKPDYAEVYNNVGNTFRAMGDLPQAMASYRKSLELKPDAAEVLNNMGVVFQEMKEPENALSAYQKALEIKPDYAEVCNNMGLVLRQQNRTDEAISSYLKAIAIKPDYPEVHNNLGNALRAKKEWDKALSCFHKALEIKPDYADARHNMGNTFQDMGEPDKAISCYEELLHIHPEHVQAHMSMGLLYQDQRKLEQAISCYENVLRIQPGHEEAYATLFHQLQHVCHWKKAGEMEKGLENMTRKALEEKRKPAETPFINLVRQDDPQFNFLVAKAWAENIEKSVAEFRQEFSFAERRKKTGKIVIGYVSNDFRNHPVSHLILSLFGLHDRNRFEIRCYSYGKDDNSSYRKRIMADCDVFADIRELSHAQAAERIYKDQVDILVELMGYTAESRLEICALRPAPVQVTYLGYPGTTAAEYMDYIITDPIVSPAEHAAYYSEKFAYVPHCYQINDFNEPIADITYTKKDFALPEDQFVFCSFNQAYKIDPIMFDVWMQIFRRVPQSVLWLLEWSPAVKKNLMQEWIAGGMEEKRVIFSPRLPKPKHLARQKLADLMLDTRLYTGHTTSSDALWAGLPLITMRGKHFPSRVSASILSAAGLPELITASLKEYEDLAVRLAQNPNELAGIREKLAQNRLTCPLFDTPRFVRNMENLYQQMWEIFCKGEKPCQISAAENS